MPRIGIDEWVARSGERTEARAGPLARLERTPPWVWLALAAGAAALFPVLTDSAFALRVGVNTLLLAMLALGLNVVVGWAGLLDLGYIAFYGFGAYAFALVSSDQLGEEGVHLAAWISIPAIMVVAAVVGLLLGLPSRRLVGDYLAIVTLFFGQVFVELVVNLDRVRLPGAEEPVSLTGGPNGIPGVDPISVLGTEIITPRGYFYLLLVLTVVLMAALYLLDRSRTGRAWRAVREDSLAASLMTIPVKAVKLMAFAFGAAIAALAGSVFAAVQAGVFPQSFETPFLILIYAALILGGAGSIAGAVLGAVVVSVTLELLRDAGQASVLFYGLVLVALIARLRPWRVLAAVLGATVAVGLAAHAVAAAISPELTAGEPALDGWAGAALDAWLVLPEGAATAGNWAFVALVCGVLATTLLAPRLRPAAIVPLLYVGAFAWEARLVGEPAITRQLLLGALLVVMMTWRAHGLLGTRRVEVV